MTPTTHPAGPAPRRRRAAARPPRGDARRVGHRAAPLLTALLALLLAGAAGAQLATLEHGGLQREYLLHVPEGLSEPAPLVLVLHGRGGSGPQMAQLTGFAEVADRFGFIVAFPSGVDGQWNYVAGVPGYDLPADDVAFLEALVAAIAAEHPVDAARVYATGFSNGGFMAQLLACQATDVFAAFASVGAAGYGGQPGVCRERHPTSIMFVHGTHDAAVPWNGVVQQTPQGPVTVLASVEQTVAFWVDRLGCTVEVDSQALPVLGGSPGTEARVLELQGCPPGVELVLVAVLGGGHNWPGHPGALPPQVAGLVNTDFDASELIWRFFERHALPDRGPATARSG